MLGGRNLNQAAQVLDCGDHQELFGGSGETSEFQAREPKLLLHVSEQHLHLSTQTARVLEALCVAKRHSFLTGGFIERH